MTNLLLHGIDIPKNVKSDNTLARPLKDWRIDEKVDVIVHGVETIGSAERSCDPEEMRLIGHRLSH